MKKIALAVCIVALALPATALGLSPTELIKGVSDDLLEGYCAPLVESYGVAMGTGLFHSARAHKFLGFDIGARLMFVMIPTSAKTFQAPVKYCQYDNKRMDTVWVTYTIEHAATIFGKRGIDSTFIPAGAVGVPPFLPGGLGISAMPFLVPQASIGLPIPGMELMVRYIPWPFEGTTVNFLGFALKQEITAVRGVDLPFNLAVQGFYQTLTIGDMVNSKSYGANIHISKSFLVIAPYAGLAFDNTSMTFDYDFTFDEPVGFDPENEQVLTESRTVPIELTFDTGATVKATFGAALKFGLILLNADYNYNLSTGYNAINFGLSLALR